jgi:hypothetical protein
MSEKRLQTGNGRTGSEATANSGLMKKNVFYEVCEGFERCAGVIFEAAELDHLVTPEQTWVQRESRR